MTTSSKVTSPVLFRSIAYNILVSTTIENVSFYAYNSIVTQYLNMFVVEVYQNLIVKNTCGWFDSPGVGTVYTSPLFELISAN